MRGANPNLPTSPKQSGVIKGRGIVILNGASKYQDVLTSSSNKTIHILNFPLALLNITVQNFFHTVR